jgi:hypothetical protein
MKEGFMRTYNVTARTRGLGILTLILAFLGFVFYWWTPFGMIVSLAGLTLGVVGLVAASGRARNLGWLIAGTVLSAAAVALNLFIAISGLELIKLTAVR